jgi:hypothetical protein
MPADSDVRALRLGQVVPNSAKGLGERWRDGVSPMRSVS